ncbi:DUF4352 domain-containing protein [Streptomyces sp. NEAU-YJ-81]|uniref:DUF4352 domain-containing protein n=1 Tax=Streptomyces sp. NEAU-YJ-81 TaxID=2820288 RepID=UPI001ABD3741|nr:DUF4352 domain-containing protein [Streptomyces sp. NEAU-YJ-81]MBO3679481.1 DUF4352 domain-containing protein [Streptomyces sp. NEAU-YJ-81]
MRTRAIALTAAILCLPLTACGNEGSKISTSPKAQSSSQAATTSEAADPAQTPAATDEPERAQDARVGDTLTLSGQNDGEQLDVTVKKWLDPAKSADEFTTPGSGKRWVAVQLQLTNTGTTAYSDSPSNCVQAADSEGQRFDATFGDITAGPQMTSDLKLPAGDKALGWIVIEVPNASKVATLQFSMNSGFADETGQWKIG